MFRLLFFLLLTASLFGQVPYTFRKVIDNAPGSALSRFSPFMDGYATMNDKGAVAFSGATSSGNVAAFYVSPEGTLSQLGGTFALVQSLNNSGTVLVGEGRELRTWSAGTTRTVYTAGSGEIFSGPASINDQGTVAWATQSRILMRTENGAVQEVVSDADVPRRNVFNAAFLAGASINNSEEIAFSTGGAATCTDCIYKKKLGGQLIRISGERSPSGGSTTRTSGIPAILDSGEVVYHKDREYTADPDYGFYLGDGSNHRTLIDMTNSRLSPNDFIVSTNEKKEVAFMALGTRAEVPDRGIYVGPDFVMDRVIAIGDTLFGQTVVALEIGGIRAGRRINNKGEIMFVYGLSNGVAGLAIATPTTDPVITKVDAEFMGKTGASAAMYLQVKGANLASTTRIWEGSDFSGTTAPTVLDGTRVTVGGKTAVVQYVSPRQVNIIVPEDTATGPVDVQVTTPTAVSNKASVNRGRVSPALLTTPAFLISGVQHVVAQVDNFTTFVGNPNMIAGAAFRRARVGETVIIYALGLGPTSPATFSNVVTGQNSNITSSIQVRIGGQVAQVPFAGAVANAIGLYQLNVVIPNVAAGNRPLEVTVDGVANAQNLVIAVGP